MAFRRRKHSSKKGKRHIESKGEIYLRSKWEANYARYLDYLLSEGRISQWEYEVDEFQFPVKRGNRFYKPDFKVWNNEGEFFYVEVKGYLDNDSKVKLKRMAQYFPDIIIRVVQGDEMKKIHSLYRKHIPEWEY